MGAALKLPLGLTRRRPCEPEFWKNDLPANLFLLHVLPQSVKLHQLFHMSNINAHLTCFSKIKACMGVKYVLVCVRKHKSNLSTNICTTVGKKTQWSVEKCELLSETTFSPFFMMAWPWCVFFYQSVYFFTNGVYHVFHHNSMFLWFFLKQYW